MVRGGRAREGRGEEGGWGERREIRGGVRGRVLVTVGGSGLGVEEKRGWRKWGGGGDCCGGTMGVGGVRGGGRVGGVTIGGREER